MSASLVGSEMCIRDSNPPASQGGRRGRAAAPQRRAQHEAALQHSPQRNTRMALYLGVVDFTICVQDCWFLIRNVTLNAWIQ
eukprot:9726165-Alexandrium_andersonii.AAC.1